MDIQERFHNFDASVQEQEMGSYTQTQQMAMLDYIYDHFDIFQILLEGAEGTRFAHFVDDWWRSRWITPINTWRSSAAKA